VQANRAGCPEDAGGPDALIRSRLLRYGETGGSAGSRGELTKRQSKEITETSFRRDPHGSTTQQECLSRSGCDPTVRRGITC